MSETTHTRKFPWRPIWLAGLSVGVVATVVFIFSLGAADKDVTGDLGPLYEVQQGPLRIQVSEAGTVRPRDQEIIKSEVEGNTTILWLIEEGAQVEQGELLIELDSSELEDRKVDQQIRVQNAEADFIQARENLEVEKNDAKSDIEAAELTLQFAAEDLTKYKEGEYPQQLKQAEGDITLAEEELNRAREKLKWSRVLFEEEYLSQTELQADELAAKKAELKLDLARTDLDLLKQYTYKRKIAQLESDLRQAEYALEREQRRATAQIVQAEARLRAQESGFEREKTKLVKLNEQIEKCKIHAPISGMVVYATSTEFSWRGDSEPLDEGQQVRERQELIHLPTTSAYIAEIKVHESSLEKIKVGMPIVARVDTLPGREFTGEVTRIAPLPDPTSVWLNPDLKVYNTQVRLEGPTDQLRTGVSCQVEIIVEEFEDAVFVPIQSVLKVDGESTVFVAEGNRAQPRRITPGLDNNRMVRIVEGLAPGERVLLAPPLAAAGKEG